jgi:hypothetical protein
MLSDATRNSVGLHDTCRSASTVGSLLSRKVWLPKLLYAAVPWFYLFSGLLALVATIYVNHWMWILPHYLIFSAATLHMGVLILRRRRPPRDDSR